MTTATRGESAPIARPADRPLSESLPSPHRPAMQHPALGDCTEFDERYAVPPLPACLRSRGNAQETKGVRA